MGVAAFLVVRKYVGDRGFSNPLAAKKTPFPNVVSERGRDSRQHAFDGVAKVGILWCVFFQWFAIIPKHMFWEHNPPWEHSPPPPLSPIQKCSFRNQHRNPLRNSLRGTGWGAKVFWWTWLVTFFLRCFFPIVYWALFLADFYFVLLATCIFVFLIFFVLSNLTFEVAHVLYTTLHSFHLLFCFNWSFFSSSNDVRSFFPLLWFPVPNPLPAVALSFSFRILSLQREARALCLELLISSKDDAEIMKGFVEKRGLTFMKGWLAEEANSLAMVKLLLSVAKVCGLLLLLLLTLFWMSLLTMLPLWLCCYLCCGCCCQCCYRCGLSCLCCYRCGCRYYWRCGCLLSILLSLWLCCCSRCSGCRCYCRCGCCCLCCGRCCCFSS